MDPATALDQLRNNTNNFLRNHHLAVSTCPIAGPTNYLFGSMGEDGAGGVRTHARGPRRSFGRQGRRKFRFEPMGNDWNLTDDHVQTMVYHLPVTHANAQNLTAMDSVQLSRNGGPGIMITTMINACSFACVGRDNDVLVQHLRPIGIDAATLVGNLTGGGFFNGSTDHPTVFGPDQGYAYGDQDATVIGLRVGDRWRFYVQTHPRGQRDVTAVTLLAEV